MILFLYILLSIKLIFCEDFTVKIVAKGFDKPIYVATPPNDATILYVVEQRGIVKKVQNNIVDSEYFLDIRKLVHNPAWPGDERGLLGLAFHPNYDVKKYIFVHYNDKEGDTVISRFLVNRDNVDLESEKIILKINQPYSNHNGGTIDFGPDDYLYIGMGDGGSSGDPQDRAQDLSNFFGSILRIDIETQDEYLIPESNPYFYQENIKKEIWAYGLRNPWRFSFDKLTGDMYIGDVGQNNWEEINWISYNINEAANFGWNIMEGLHCYNEDKCIDDNAFIEPIFEYPNDAKYAKTLFGIKQSDVHGCSVTGGYIYRGAKIPSIYGRYFFGDYCTGKIWSFINNDGVVSDFQDHTKYILEKIGKKEFYLSSFGQDASGEIYLIDYNGSVYKIISN